MHLDKRLVRARQLRRQAEPGSIPLAVLGTRELPPELARSSRGKRGVFGLAYLDVSDLPRLRDLEVRGVLVDDDLGSEQDIIAAIQLCRAVRPELPVLVITSAPGTGRRLIGAGATFSLHKSGITVAAVRSVLLGAAGAPSSAKQEVTRSARTFEAAYEFSTDVIIGLTTDGRILSVNAAAAELLGVDRESLIGRELAALAAPGHGDEHHDMLTTVASGVAASAFETRWCGREGELIPMSLSAAPMRADDDLLVGAIVVGRDTRDAKRTEELQRLASIGQLAAGVAHEINNPATFVRGNATLLREAIDELLRDDGRDPASRLRRMRDMVDDCLLGMDRIAAVVKDLSVFSRIEHDDVALVSVNTLVANAAALAGNELRHRAELELVLGDVPNIAVDRAKVAQVFLNLLVNAAHAVGEDGAGRNVVRVETRVVEQTVRIVVSDTGCGIAPQHLDRIFAPFFTTKPRERGTGLGLAISLETVRRHGGDMHVRTSLGRGSEFEVVLPIRTELHRAELDDVRPGTAHSAPETTGDDRLQADDERRRVLLIDDEPRVRRTFQRLLSRHHDVSEADGGAAAIDLLEAGKRYDVIFCDLMMPGVDGVAFWRWVRDEEPELLERIVFVSGGAVTTHARAFLDEESPTVLEKPVGRHELLAAIESLGSNASASEPQPAGAVSSTPRPATTGSACPAPP